MKLVHIQCIYFLLHAIQYDHGKKYKCDLIVNADGKLITADFLSMNARKTAFQLEQFDFDGDIKLETVSISQTETHPFAEVFGAWRREKNSPFLHAGKLFERPDILLDEIVSFLNKNSNLIDNQVPPTNKVLNLHYLESDIIYKNARLRDDGYEIIALEATVLN